MYEKDMRLTGIGHSQLNCGAFKGWIGQQGAVSVKYIGKLLHGICHGDKTLSPAILIELDAAEGDYRGGGVDI